MGPFVICALLSMTLCGRAAPAPDDWPAAWETVARHREAGRYREAIAQTLELEGRAVRANAWDHAARAVLERFSLEHAANPKSRDRQLMVLVQFTREAPDTIRPILACALAHFYWESFLENPARYAGRSQLADPAEEGENPAHWSFPRLKQAIDEQVTVALNASERLKRIPVETYAGLLCEGTVSDRYRPTLFDLVAHDALALWRTVHSVNGKWEDDPFTWPAEGPAFEDADRFIQAIPSHAETGSHLLKSLQLYRELLKFHDNDRDKTAFAAVDLDRLTFCFEFAKGDDVREKYTGAIDQFIVRWRQSPISSRAAAIRARLAFEDGQPGIAHLIASRGSSGFPETEVGVQQCREWIRRIERSSFSIAVESVWCEPWPAFTVTYRNLRELHFRAVPLSGKEMLAQLDLSDGERLANWLARKAVKAWSVPLPPCTDYKERQHNFPVPAKLPRGRYVLLIADNPDFSPRTGTVLTQEIQVSRLALALTEQDGILRGGTVLDANSGSPIAGAAVQLWTTRGQTSRVYTCKHVFKTDFAGRFAIDGANKDIRLCVMSGRDTLWTPRAYRQGHFSEKFAPLHEAYLLLTDKPAYSPGQRVRFSGVAFAADRQNATYFPLKNNQVTIALKSPGNPRPFAEQEQLSDSFGTFSGSFTLPDDFPLGTAQLVAGGNTISFQVECYRIPAFEVQLDPPLPTARLNSLVTLDGRVRSLAGEALPGAAVTWSVSRKGILPPWSPHSGQPAPGDGEIANGRTAAAPDGSFSISFFTQADKKIPAEESPAFDFTLQVTVSDISGETHTAETRLHLGQAAWQAAFQCNPWQTTRKPVGIRLALTTLRGEPVANTGKLRVYPLKQPSALRRPAQTGTEGYPLAPNLLDQWESEEELASETISTGTNGLAVGRISLPAGAFRLVFETRDTGGTPITAKQTLVVLDPGKNQLKMAIPELFRIEKTSLQPGETLRIYWGTGYASGSMWLEVLQGSRVWLAERSDPKRTQQFFELPVTEAMRGGLTVRTLFVRENRIYTHTERIDVPWTNKRLDLRWEQRSTQTGAGVKTAWRAIATLPGGAGAKGAWTATLYDCSLDAVAEPNWPERGFLREFRREPYEMYATTFVNARQTTSPVSAQPEIPPEERFPWIPTSLLRVATTVPVPDLPDEGFTFPFSQRPLREAEHPAMTLAPLFRANTNAASCFLTGLTGDDDGQVVFDFTTPPESGTWRFRAFSHDADLRAGSLCADLTTQRDFTLSADLPTHLHEEDTWRLALRIQRHTPEKSGDAIKVSVRFLPTDLHGKTGPSLALAQPVRTLALAPGETRSCEWQLQIPRDIVNLSYTLEATSEGFSDSRTGDIPVRSQSLFSTVRLPLTPNGDPTPLAPSGEAAASRPPERLWLEMIGDPLWCLPDALSALSRATGDLPIDHLQRLTARVIGRRFRESRPDLLAMAPLLLGEQTSDSVIARELRKLGECQLPTGGWSLIPGSPENEELTLVILSTLADLFALGLDPKTVPGVAAALEALDRKNAEPRETLHPRDIHRIFVRTRFLATHPLPASALDPLRAALKAAAPDSGSLPSSASRAQLAIALSLTGQHDAARRVADGLRTELAARDPERPAGTWYDNPVARTALMWRFAKCVLNDPLAAGYRNGLLSLYRGGDWENPAARLSAAIMLADAVYPKTDIGTLSLTIGEKVFRPDAGAAKLGYWTTTLTERSSPPLSGEATLTDTGAGEAWCGLFKRSGHPARAIPVSETAPLGIRKAYFIRRHTERGAELSPVKEAVPLGSELVCRLEIRADRDFEAVRLRDDTPACAEPVNRYPFTGKQGDLTFYGTPGTEGMTVLIERLPRGMHLLEYTCRVKQAGQFWSGIAELAPYCLPSCSATSNETTFTVTAEAH